jgi:hypothetical protein
VCICFLPTTKSHSCQSSGAIVSAVHEPANSHNNVENKACGSMAYTPSALHNADERQTRHRIQKCQIQREVRSDGGQEESVENSNIPGRDDGLLTRIKAIMRLSKASLMEAGSLKVDLIALHCRFLQSLSEQCTVRRCVSSSLPTPLLLAIGCPSAKPGPPNPACHVDI